MESKAYRLRKHPKHHSLVKHLQFKVNFKSYKHYYTHFLANVAWLGIQMLSKD